jgi:hypothetical protein
VARVACVACRRASGAARRRQGAVGRRRSAAHSSAARDRPDLWRAGASWWLVSSCARFRLRNGSIWASMRNTS